MDNPQFVEEFVAAGGLPFHRLGGNQRHGIPFVGEKFPRPWCGQGPFGSSHISKFKHIAGMILDIQLLGCFKPPTSR